MRDAANNAGGAMNGFIGMGMAGLAGGSAATNLFSLNQDNARANNEKTLLRDNAWTCHCGTSSNGKFCPECGTPKPEMQRFWKCKCGAMNTGNFCPECGEKRNDVSKPLRCKNCGYELDVNASVPKFCPDCGSAFTG